MVAAAGAPGVHGDACARGQQRLHLGHVPRQAQGGLSRRCVTSQTQYSGSSLTTAPRSHEASDLFSRSVGHDQTCQTCQCHASLLGAFISPGHLGQPGHCAPGPSDPSVRDVALLPVARQGRCCGCRPSPFGSPGCGCTTPRTTCSPSRRRFWTRWTSGAATALPRCAAPQNHNSAVLAFGPGTLGRAL